MDSMPHRINIFPGINDTPREPTANKAGNASHVISKFNQYIQSASTEFNSLGSRLDTSQADLSALSAGLMDFKGIVESGVTTVSQTETYNDPIISTTKVRDVSGELIQNSGVRITIPNSNYFFTLIDFWFTYQNQVLPIELKISGFFPNQSFKYDWSFRTVEGYPGQISNDFEIFGYQGLGIGVGSNLGDINLSKSGIHFSIIGIGLGAGYIDFYSNYNKNIPFNASIKGFYIPIETETAPV